MKNSVFSTILTLIATATISAQDLTQDPKAVQEVEALERQVTEALARRDRATLEGLLAEGFTFIHASGQLVYPISFYTFS